MSYRQIKFAGRFSLLDFGVYIGSEFDTDTRREKAKPRTIREKIPFMNGSYDFTKISGKVIYDDQKLYYTFIIGEKTKELVAEKADKLDAWLSSEADELYDSAYPGWKFVGVRYEGMSEIQYYSHNENKGRVTVELTSSPYLRSTTGTLIDIATIIPSSGSQPYLYSEYGGRGYIAALAQPDAPLSFTLTTAQANRLDVTYVGAAAEHWVGLSKSAVSGYTLKLVGDGVNSFDIGEDSRFSYVYCTKKAASFSVTGTIGGQPASGSAIASVIPQVVGCHSTTEYKSFELNSVPVMQHLRMLSEGTPTLTIDGSPADVDDFALLRSPVQMRISGAYRDPCKLQYCTVKERR